jgi:iron(III) transport system ATP-binding protein
VAYGLKLRKLDKETIKKKVMDILALVGLEGMEGRMTNQLSGGQQQRVALARALVLEPGVLLFDEPLSNLDAKLRVSMRTEIRRIQQEAGITAIYVTHDQSEAMALSDQIIIMEKGVVAQIGTPQEVYYHPQSEFVADFIGEANFLRGKLTAQAGDTGAVEVAGQNIPVGGVSHLSKGQDCTLVLRPEAATLCDQGQLPCKVVLSCFMGSYQNYHVMVGNTLVKITDFNPKSKKIYQVGDSAWVNFVSDDIHVL